MQTDRRRRARSVGGTIAAVAVVLAACGSDESAAPGGESPPDSGSPADPGNPSDPETSPSTTVFVGDGWIGGEPDWGGGGVRGSTDELGMEMDASAGDEVLVADASGGRRADGASVDLSGPVPEPIPGPIDESPLRAGSVDDNVDVDDFLAYLDRVGSLGIEGRPIDLTGRIVVEVVDGDGAPVPGISIVPSFTPSSATEATPMREIRTTADGTVRYFPGLDGLDGPDGVEPDTSITFSIEGSDENVTALPGDTVTLVVESSADVASPVPLDVLFLLDATGSMADEIDRLKDTIDQVADQVNALDPRPDVRFAMTLYRDEGDAFVTSTHDFTGDVEAFRSALSDAVADGGGDYPEALDEGLAEALSAPAWREPSEAVQLVFVVADAPPQVSRQVDVPYTSSMREAVSRGIKVLPVASSESDDQAELVFRQLAVATGAPFVFLSYGAGGAATGPSSDIDSTDYEELPLDQLVVRLIAEELSDLAGGDGGPVTPPTTAPPTTSIPDGQQQPGRQGVTVTSVVDDVAWYPACGNEELVVEGARWYQLQDDEVKVLGLDEYPIIADELLDDTTTGPEGLLRVAEPGPGDDVGRLVEYSTGYARWESQSGRLVVWVTTDERTYDWVC
ncbi:MAG: VWA domain-containing protein [Actinomycetota bacterium]